jgi:hypothetical protein
MTLTEILENDILHLPLNINTDDIFKELLDYYDKYMLFIDRINQSNSEIKFSNIDIDRIDAAYSIILRAIQKYLSGTPGGAYTSFIKIFTILNDEITYFCLENMSKEELPFENLYRLRVAKDSVLKREDIFHVPFSKRKYVNSYRFSIPGLPAIYLGSSSYVCWEELSRISLDELFISRFRFNKGIQVNLLNISTTSELLLTLLAENSVNAIESLKNHLILWPLVAACEIKVKTPEAPFKPEYIIPQLLLQYIAREKKYDGIIYSSTRINATKVDPKKCFNVVLPVQKKGKNSDYCEILKEKILVSEPISIKFYKTTIHKGFSSTDPHDFELVKGLSTHYMFTDFGYIERAVNKLDVEKIR